MITFRAYLFAMIGAALWGIIGLFIDGLYQFGFTPWEVVAIRVITSFFIMFTYLVITKPHLLKLRLRDSVYMIGTGVLSLVFFNWCYFYVIEQTSLSLAVILLYTGPIFVTLLSRLLFKEALTGAKMTALGLTFIGCALVVGFLPNFNVTITWQLLLIGLGSGFCYALYSIFGKYVSSRYSTLTVITYSFLFASLFIFPTSDLWEKSNLFVNGQVLFLSFGLAIIPTCLAYFFYTYGLTYIESSRASILAMVEPVVAIMIGVGFFQETLTVWQLSGMGLIFVSIFLTVDRKDGKSVAFKNETANKYS